MNTDPPQKRQRTAPRNYLAEQLAVATTTFKQRHGSTDLGRKVLAVGGRPGVRKYLKLARITGRAATGVTLDDQRQQLYDAGVFDDETAHLHQFKLAQEASAAAAAAAAAEAPLQYAEVAAKIYLPSLLESGEPLHEKITRYWHACYCYGELARTIAPAAFELFCSEHAEVLKLMGMRLTMLPIVSSVVEHMQYETIDRQQAAEYIDNDQYISYAKKITEMAKEHRGISSDGRAAPRRAHGARRDAAPRRRIKCLVIAPFKYRGKQIAGALIDASTAAMGTAMGNSTHIEMMTERLSSDFGVEVPSSSCFNLGVKSPVWKHLRQSDLRFEDFACTEGTHAEVMVASCFQGEALIGGSHGYMMRREDGTARFFITEQANLITANNDRFSAAQLSGAEGWEHLFEHITALEGGLMSQNKPRLASIVADCAQNATHIYALLRLINEERDDRGLPQMQLPRAPERHAVLSQVDQSTDGGHLPSRFQRCYDMFQKLLSAGAFTVSSTFRSDSLSNFWHNAGESSWNICALILHANEGLLRKHANRSCRAAAASACEPPQEETVHQAPQPYLHRR